MKRALFVPLFVALVGCGSSESPPPPTSDQVPLDQLTLHVSVRSNGEAALVMVNLSSPQSSLVYLGEGDRLFARAGATSAELVAFGYQRGVLLSTSSSTIDVVLERGTKSGVAHVPLPLAFGLDAPVELPRRTPFTVRWGPLDPAGKAPVLRVESECLSAVARAPSIDSGSYTFDPADFFVRVPGPCIAVLTATRADASLRPTFEGLAGAQSSGSQVRTLTFRMNP